MNRKSTAQTAAPPAAWSTRTRLAVSLLLMIHLLAVVIPPLSVEPASQLCGMVFGVLRPYIDATFLDHGYRFFAPEPGPSHLIRYELDLADGTRRDGVFPNRAEHWPRLLYHRHFMLTEFVNSLEFRPDVAEAYARSYARHLQHESGAREVRLFLRRHRFPTPQQVLAGMRLDDPSLYLERPLGNYTSEGQWRAALPPPQENRS